MLNPPQGLSLFLGVTSHCFPLSTLNQKRFEDNWLHSLCACFLWVSSAGRSFPQCICLSPKSSPMFSVSKAESALCLQLQEQLLHHTIVLTPEHLPAWDHFINSEKRKRWTTKELILLKVSVLTVTTIRNNSRPSVLRDPKINSLDSELSPWSLVRMKHSCGHMIDSSISIFPMLNRMTERAQEIMVIISRRMKDLAYFEEREWTQSDAMQRVQLGLLKNSLNQPKIWWC